MKPSARDVLALGFALAAAWLTHQFVLDLALVGWDTYPIIAASRVGGLGELSGLFTEEWMGGRYPRGHFYRPVSALSFALDHTLWGLEPRGYQWTNLACLLFAVTAVYAVARAWLGSAIAAGVAALTVAVHPAMLEVVPVSARRSDLLALAFVACTLAIQRFDAAPGRLRITIGALFAALAVAAKETGVVVIPAVLAAHAWLPGVAAPRACLRRAGVGGGPAALAALAVVVLRSAVLGGLGGHPDSSLLGGAIAGIQGAGTWLHFVLEPQPWTELPFVDLAIAGILAGGLGLATWWTLEDDPSARPVAAVLAVWAVSLLLLAGVSGDPASWYAAPLLAPYALLLGLITRAVPRRWPAVQRSAVAAAAFVAVLLVSYIVRSDPLQGYEGWRSVSRHTAQFLRTFDATLAGAQPGDVVSVEGLPLGFGAPIERIGIRSALGLTDYSVAAYAELTVPGRIVRVVLQDTVDSTPASGETVTVRVTPLPLSVTPE
ncbi:MAG: hypothetical protein QF890_01155 [Myxococcota bacterium]|nr:hypothetical protein [Deltaproteobacteria bacterium]MCP4244303.1 hypothetical protein [bacterium]MDP6074911.1 hypothetical protein [Myxococcota bacterium]MBT40149.1 hypothetical protein [Deltaproteobacteria bacterium]MDP6241878.1 hypothetical protein [Myxococcota bacterium]